LPKLNLTLKSAARTQFYFAKSTQNAGWAGQNTLVLVNDKMILSEKSVPEVYFSICGMLVRELIDTNAVKFKKGLSMTLRSQVNKLKVISAHMLLCFASAVFPDQFESLVQSYGILSTIAGRGGSGDGVVNEWQNTFEGKTAVEAVLSSPHFAMADSSGNVYIADKDAHAIRKVDKDGIITTAAGINSAGDGSDGKANEQALSSPNGLWVSRDGVLYILDLGNSKVKKVDKSGHMTTVFKDDDGFGGGRALWVSNTEDTIWYAGVNSVKRWTAAGGCVLCAGGFSGLGNITQDSKGAIVATDRSANLVYRIGPDTVKTVIAGTGATSGGGDRVAALQTAFYGVRGVWFLDDNSYFLATHEGCQVWYIDTNGIAYIFLDGKDNNKSHTGDGEHFRTPGLKVREVRSVSVDYQGNVLVTEHDKGYIRKVARKNSGVIRNRTVNNSNVSPVVISTPQKLIVNFQTSGMGNISVQLIDLAGRGLSPQMRYHLHKKKHTVEIEKKAIPAGVYRICIDSGEEFFSGTTFIIK
jgi:streptogramin lyase